MSKGVNTKVSSSSPTCHIQVSDNLYSIRMSFIYRCIYQLWSKSHIQFDIVHTCCYLVANFLSNILLCLNLFFDKGYWNLWGIKQLPCGKNLRSYYLSFGHIFSKSNGLFSRPARISY